MSPALILSFTLAIFLGSLAHVLVGRRIWQWPLFVVASLAGFFGGFFAGVAWDINWLQLGDVPLFTSITGALLAIALAWFFSVPRATSTATEPNG